MACSTTPVPVKSLIVGVLLLAGSLVFVACSGAPGPEVLADAGEPPVVTGVVLDGAGRPLREAEVLLYRMADGPERSRMKLDGRRWPEPEATVEPREDGSFRLVAPGPGVFSVVARGPGRVAMESPLWPLLEATDVGTVRLRPDLGWRVRVVDAEGLPVPDAVVAAWLRGDREVDDGPEVSGEGFWRRVQLQVAAAGADGWVRLSRLEQDLFGLSAVSAGRFARVRSVTPEDATPVVVRLPDGPPRRVDVRRPDGSPAVGSVVLGAGVFSPLGITGAEGRVELRGVIDRPMRIWVDGGDGLRTSGMFEPDSAGATDPLRAVLEPPGELRGRVVDAATGAPVAGAWVMQSANPTGFVRTARSGRFRLPLTNAGRSLAAEAPGYERLDWLLEGDLEDWGAPRGPVIVPLRRRATDGPVVKRYQ